MSFYYGASTLMCLAKCMAVFFAVYLTNLSQNKTNVNPAEQLYLVKTSVNTKKEQYDERNINSTFTEMARMALEYCINSIFIFDWYFD